MVAQFMCLAHFCVCPTYQRVCRSKEHLETQVRVDPVTHKENTDNAHSAACILGAILTFLLLLQLASKWVFVLQSVGKTHSSNVSTMYLSMCLQRTVTDIYIACPCRYGEPEFSA